MRSKTTPNHIKSRLLFLSILLVTFSSRCRATKALRSPKIMRGNAALRGEFPAFAAIFIILLDEEKFQCGGCYIRRLWIATAGHCLYNKTTRKAYAIETIFVRMGMLQLTENAQQRRSKRLIIHRNYEPELKNRFHDIGLVQVTRPFDIVPQTVNIARLNVKQAIPRNVAVVGFGLMNGRDVNPSNQMQVVHLMVWKKKDDLLIIKDRALKGACFGDSGGPLYLRQGKQVIGLVSAGICAKGLGYYTNIGCYRKWLAKNISEDGGNLEAKAVVCAYSFLLLLLYDYLLFRFNNK